MDSKICQNIKPPTLTHIPFSVQLSTWGRLEDQARNSFYTFCYMLIVLKCLLASKTKFNCFKKMYIFSYSLLPKIFKLRKSSLRLVFLVKIAYNIVRTPSPFLKRGEVNFDYLPWRGGIWKIRKRGWKYRAWAGSLKKRVGRLTLFLFNFFNVYHFCIQKLLYPLQNFVIHLEKIYFFLSQ